MKLISFVFIALLAFSNIAWYSPRTSTNLTASQDVLASSTDTHSVGTSGNIWKNSYLRREYIKESGPTPTTIASFGVVWVSTDNNLYFTNDAGSSEKITAL